MVDSFILSSGLLEHEWMLIVRLFDSSEVGSVFELCLLDLGFGVGLGLALLSVESFKLLFVEEFGYFGEGIVGLLASG
jgi:hypothetical protein